MGRTIGFSLGTRLADQKAISVLSFLRVFMIFFIAYLYALPVNTFALILVIISLISGFSSVISLILTINPRIKIIFGNNENLEKNYDPTFSEVFVVFKSFRSLPSALRTWQVLKKMFLIIIHIRFIT